MCPSWPTVNPAPESHTPWEPAHQMRRTTPNPWVRCETFPRFPSEALRFLSFFFFLKKATADWTPGIIPRAAQMLFEKLGEPPKPNRNSSSGLRTPGRYSLSSQTGVFGKNGLDKNWQLKATYVEVRKDARRWKTRKPLTIAPDLQRTT